MKGILDDIQRGDTIVVRSISGQSSVKRAIVTAAGPKYVTAAGFRFHRDGRCDSGYSTPSATTVEAYELAWERNQLRDVLRPWGLVPDGGAQRKLTLDQLRALAALVRSWGA